MHTWTFQDSAWRQGSVIPRELIPHGTLPVGTPEDALLIVISHDCDVVQQNEIEPFIEFVVARPLSQYRKDGMAFRCKNPRRLQLWIQQNCGHQLYEVSAHEKYKIGRDSLRGHEPSDLKLSAPDIAILSEWASRRYKRYSFPTEFNRRIPRKALEKIKRVLTSDGEDVVIYMGLTSSEELPAEVTYDTLVRVVIPRDAMEDDFREQRALKVVAALRANLSACAGINLIEVTLESRADFTLEDIDSTVEWDEFEYLSLAPGDAPKD